MICPSKLEVFQPASACTIPTSHFRDSTTETFPENLSPGASNESKLSEDTIPYSRSVCITSKQSCTQGTKSSVKLNHNLVGVYHFGLLSSRSNQLLGILLALFSLRGHAHLSHSTLRDMFQSLSSSRTIVPSTQCLGLAWAVLLPRLGAVSAVYIGFNMQQLEMRRTFGPERRQVT